MVREGGGKKDDLNALTRKKAEEEIDQKKSERLDEDVYFLTRRVWSPNPS
jgi:hypothetical protein